MRRNRSPEIFISGAGAVSPAGWSLDAMRATVLQGAPVPSQPLQRAGVDSTLKVLLVPPPQPRPAFLAHSRLRRTSPISQFAVAAVLEALGPNHPLAQRTAVIACVFSGCVNYSRRFYEETLRDPGTASPLLFPETVFNAPASHISAYLGSSAINYTLVGDAGVMLAGLALGARWLLDDKAEQCVVVGTEEIDWLTADALRLFDRSKHLSEGAGAVLLSRSPQGAKARLDCVTDEFLYSASNKRNALAKMKAQLGTPLPGATLLDSTSSDRGISRDESSVWSDWAHQKISVKKTLGEGLMASAAWQLALAADSVGAGTAPQAWVSIAGFHQHAIGARLSAL